MELARPHEDCTIDEDGRYIRAEVGSGRSAAETHECYRTLGSLILQHGYSRALVVGLGEDDALHHLAARDVVIALDVIGVPAGFKLALVPCTEPTLNGFKHAEAEGRQRGLRVKVFSDEESAVRWLTEAERH